MRQALFVMATLGAAVIWIALGLWLPWWLIALVGTAAAIWLIFTPTGQRSGSITAAGMATLPQRLGGGSARTSQNGTVRVYLEKIADPRDANRIALAIDALSANSDHETITQTSSAIAAAQVRQLANISLIVHAIMGAVAFTLMSKGLHLPMVPIVWAIWAQGLGLMALVGLVVGVLPALRAMRLRVVDALAGW